MVIEINLGDVVRLKKVHPCGGYEWQVVRLGADIGLKCLKCELGEPDASGRRRPVEIKGSLFEIPCDVAIIAVGLSANQVLTKVTPRLNLDKYGDIIVSPETMETSVKGVYAGGDIVGGEGTVIEAMGMAKLAASSIMEYLSIKKQLT